MPCCCMVDAGRGGPRRPAESSAPSPAQPPDSCLGPVCSTVRLASSLLVVVYSRIMSGQDGGRRGEDSLQRGLAAGVAPVMLFGAHRGKMQGLQVPTPPCCSSLLLPPTFCVVAGAWVPKGWVGWAARENGALFSTLGKCSLHPFCPRVSAAAAVNPPGQFRALLSRCCVCRGRLPANPFSTL